MTGYERDNSAADEWTDNLQIVSRVACRLGMSVPSEKSMGSDANREKQCRESGGFSSSFFVLVAQVVTEHTHYAVAHFSLVLGMSRKNVVRMRAVIG